MSQVTRHLDRSNPPNATANHSAASYHTHRNTTAATSDTHAQLTRSNNIMNSSNNNMAMTASDGADYWRHPGQPSADMVLVHVIDEQRKINKHYCCKRELMLKHMRYFADYLTEDRAYDDVDISVHCDSDIFEWLLTYIHDPDNPPPLDKTRVVSVLISSEFLLMDKLVELCLDFFADNLTDVIRLPIDLSCLTDRVLRGLAERCSAEKLANAKDRKGKLLHKLYKIRAEIDFSSATAAGLVQCCRCGLVYCSDSGSYLTCQNANAIIDAHGRLVRRHERVRPAQWSLFSHIQAIQQMPLSWECIYWYLWAACRVIRGQQLAVSALQVDQYVVDDVTIRIQQPVPNPTSSAVVTVAADAFNFRLDVATSTNGAPLLQDQADASTFGLGDTMLLKSQHKQIAAAYAASQELFKKQVLAQEIAMPVITVGQSVTPASSEYDADDTSEEPLLPPPPPRTPPEKPPTRGRTRQQEALHRGRMRPMSADKRGGNVASAAVRPDSRHRRLQRPASQSRRRSRSLSSGFVRRLESSLSLQQAAERELTSKNFDIFTQLPDEFSGAPQPFNGVFVGPHPLSTMPKAYFSSLRKAQASNQSEEKRGQWEIDLLREFDESRLTELQQRIAQARAAFHATAKAATVS